MKVTSNWLKQYVDFNWSPEELAERLTMLGLEVEGVQKLGGEFEGVVVAEVITKDKHPNADKLTLCRVNDGKGERQIVCGATNFKPGDKVPLILPGASLPAKPGEQPFTIKVGKIRGVESHGMMCSPKELGLADDAQGLLILREDARVGQSFAEYLGRAVGDVVYDLEITPNRPDLNSLIGIAREIAAVTGNPLHLPELSVVSSQWSVADLVAVRIEDAELCPRYVARVVRGVKIGPSPDWLRTALEKVGLRSINNVVDVTNYVMMETGQPLHAFDYHLIAHAPAAVADDDSTVQRSNDPTPTIVIRRAQAGELFVTLDGQRHTLTGEMLLIADEQKGIALAGVMGGQNTEINERTEDVLIESAYFKPANIRRTARALGLRTDASYRFERGADIGMTDWASLRCAQLILTTAGGQLADGAVDAYPNPARAREIALRHNRANELLGVEIPVDQQIELLRRLGLEVAIAPGVAPSTGVRLPHTTTFRVPSWRVDLKRETDLIEEVERLYGLEKVPATPPRGAIGSNPFDCVHDQIAEARRLLAGLGLNEAQGQTLISDAAAQLAAPSASFVLLANPLSGDMNALRPSLLPGLLDSLRHNLAHKNEAVALFEIGRVFAQANGQLKEDRRVAVALTGQRQAPFWSGNERGAAFDLHDLKGIVEEFLEHYGLRGLTYTKRAESSGLFVESAEIALGGRQPLGELGQLLPRLAKRYDLRDAVLLAELDLDLLLARRNTAKSFKPLPACPAVRRDVAMFVPEAATHDAVLQAVKQAKPANLEGVELFDVFRGQNVPAGHKSLAYAFTYRHAERTLTDAEVNAAQDKLVAHLKQALQAIVREGQ
ncbi:MAG: phenylalanine--tRNA ligase subunit beta [Verrucomicrobia bacterium]|nr:phenylalanine--tRNA ligase subunit beta [Verrucomicrobiota bacterium]